MKFYFCEIYYTSSALGCLRGNVLVAVRAVLDAVWLWRKEREIILHEAAAKALKAAGISKLPNITVLQSKYEKHQEQKEAIYTDYGKLKKQVKEYDVIKQNIDSILRQGKEQEREKEKNMESSFVHICVI